MKLLKKGMFFFLSVIVLSFSSCSKKEKISTTNPFVSQDDGLIESPEEQYQEEMIALINQVRSIESDCGGEVIAPSADVKWDSRLYAAALAHANSMNDKNYFSHQGQDGSDVATRVERTGYTWRNVGENIAFDFVEVAMVNEGFVNSPTHCKVMNNASYLEVGIANVGQYWVVVFGTHL